MEVIYVKSYGHPLPPHWIRQYYVECSEGDWFGSVTCYQKEPVYELLGKKNVKGVPVTVEKCPECENNLRYLGWKNLNQPKETDLVINILILPEVYYRCDKCETEVRVRYPRFESF